MILNNAFESFSSRTAFSHLGYGLIGKRLKSLQILQNVSFNVPLFSNEVKSLVYINRNASNVSKTKVKQNWEFVLVIVGQNNNVLYFIRCPQYLNAKENNCAF